MANREKVIAEFEDIQRSLNAGYGVAITDKSELVRDTLELLKEQEAVYPIKDIARNKRCPKCFSILKGKFCYDCGQEVKWE